MSHIEEWHDCDFVGIIKRYEEPKQKDEQIELMDDYDARMKLGSKVRIVRSRFDKMEA